MNSIQIIGRLTKDPELTTTKAGQALCRMRVAVPRPGSDAEAVYIDVVAWERLAETCGEHRPRAPDSGQRAARLQRVERCRGCPALPPRDRGQWGRLPRPAEDQARRGRVAHAGVRGQAGTTRSGPSRAYAHTRPVYLRCLTLPSKKRSSSPLGGSCFSRGVTPYRRIYVCPPSAAAVSAHRSNTSLIASQHSPSARRATGSPPNFAAS